MLRVEIKTKKVSPENRITELETQVKNLKADLTVFKSKVATLEKARG